MCPSLRKVKAALLQILETIWLTEIDLNAGSKIHFVSWMINSTALQHNAIQPSEYAKKGSKAIEAVIVKILYFDQLRQNKKPGFFCVRLDGVF